MKIIQKYIAIALGATTLLGSCEKALDLKPHASKNSEDVVNEKSIRSLVNGGYEIMQKVEWYGRDYQTITDVGGDDVKITAANSNRFISEYRYNYSPTVASQSVTWEYIYSAIYSMNNVINGIADNPNTRPYLGEAYFIRGLAHFDLARRWARPYTNVAAKPNDPDTGIPIVLKNANTFEEFINFLPKRSTLKETYDAIIADLKKAQELAPSASEGSVFRASRDAATALLVRVYLYMGDWDNVIKEADKLDGKFKLWKVDEIPTSWTTNNTPEEIFTLRFKSTEGRGANNFGNLYIYDGYGDIRPTTQWLGLLDSGDARLQYIAHIEDEDIDLLHKFTGTTSEGAVGLVDFKLLRYAEVLLSRAEAYSEKGDLKNALKDVNALRANRGLKDFESTSIEDVKKEIVKQRRIELIGEGHRMFDLFRKNETRKVKDADALAVADITPDNFRVAYPIPTGETDLKNSKVVQNPGYLPK